ncbi:hypothetical protein CR513_54654, partial [Mucuna pruriens]
MIIRYSLKVNALTCLLHLGDVDLLVDAYVVDLSGLDIVLEIAWLKSLGKVTTGYEEMSYHNQNKTDCFMDCEAKRNNKMTDLHALSLHRGLGIASRRNIVHSIVLQDGTGSITVRPHRYSHHYKTEIERQVNDISSPFSNAVILIKIKDYRWHMCVDYRTLNKVSVGQIRNTRCLPMLDLKCGYHRILMEEDNFLY